jgi:hypothetical protein
VNINKCPECGADVNKDSFGLYCTDCCWELDQHDASKERDDTEYDSWDDYEIDDYFDEDLDLSYGEE